MLPIHVGRTREDALIFSLRRESQSVSPLSMSRTREEFGEDVGWVLIRIYVNNIDDPVIA